MTAPKLVLYYSDLCPYAARAVLAFAETGIDHEAVLIDLAVPRPDWYLKDINPYGQVPAIKVNDKDVILESLFAAEYISDLSPETGLFPTDALQRAQTRYLIHHWGTHVQPVIHKASFTAVDPKELAEARAQVITELEKFNTLLLKASKSDNQGPYFLGEKFTFADLTLAPFMARFFYLGAFKKDYVFPTRESHPQLERFFEWKEALEKRPSLIKVTASREALMHHSRKFLKE